MKLLARAQMVREAGIEPARVSPQASKACASASSATLARSSWQTAGHSARGSQRQRARAPATPLSDTAADRPRSRSSAVANFSSQKPGPCGPIRPDFAARGGVLSLQCLVPVPGGTLLMVRRNFHRGFSLLETFVAMVLVAIAATGLVVAFVGSTKFGVLARRQANAVALARSVAGQLTRAPYSDARLANNNTQNDTTFADPNALFSLPTLPTGNDAPDSS